MLLRKRILIPIILALFSVSLMAQGETAVSFLRIAPDSRAGGMGESGAGLADNSAAIFWNPAGIAFLRGIEGSFTHSQWLPQFQLSDLFYEYLTGRAYLPELGVDVPVHATTSLTYMNFGEINLTDENGGDLGTFRAYDMAFTLGFATKLHDDWGLGMNFRLIHSRLSPKGAGEEEGSGTATGVSFDVAAMWRPAEFDIPYIADMSNRFSLGMNLSNIGPAITYIDEAQSDPIPQNFRLGIAAILYQDEYNSLTYTMDFNKLLVDKLPRDFSAVVNDTTKEVKDKKPVPKRDPYYKALFTAWGDESFNDEMKDITTAIGLEYVYGDPSNFQFAFRTGFFYEDPNRGNRKFATFGVGLKYDIYGFDFGYITTSIFGGDSDQHPLSDTKRFTLFISWDSLQKREPGFPRGY